MLSRDHIQLGCGAELVILICGALKGQQKIADWITVHRADSREHRVLSEDVLQDRKVLLHRILGLLS